MLRILCSIVFVLSANIVFPQKEYSKWMVGKTDLLDFSQDPPVVVPNFFKNDALGSPIAISDADGKVLFYITGNDIYNSENTSILKLSFNTISKEVITVPVLSVKNKYLYFPTFLGYPGGQALYSIDMNANNGKGSVSLIGAVQSQGFSIVKRFDSDSYWLVCFYGDNTTVYPLTEDGLGKGTQYPFVFPEYIQKCKVSPDMSTLFIETETDLYSLGFNNSTGELGALSKIISHSPDFYIQYEFSFDNQYIYIISHDLGTFEFTISQYLLDAASDEASFAQSQKLIYTGRLGEMQYMKDIQMGPDRNIYISVSKDQYLWRIENTDQAWPGCRVNPKGIQLLNPTEILPHFLHYKSPLRYTQSCSSFTFFCDTKKLTNLSWDFGDGQTSTLASPSHTYTATGTYTVSLTATNSSGQTQKVSKTVSVYARPTAPVIKISGGR